jgi:L-threonylcarbamoyladenylate synthase
MPPIPVIRVDPSGDFQDAVKKASDILLAGGLVVYPTESFYGFAADSTNENAIRRLFLVKKRSPGRPLLILIPSVEALDPFVAHIPTIARELIHEFWPGGLTLVFEAGQKVSPLLTAGTDKIGIRLSPHPIATALARTLGAPITGTSANISGKPACKNAGEVLSAFKEWVDLILDGGVTPGEVGSTVLDITVDPPEILREGIIQKKDLEKYISV